LCDCGPESYAKAKRHAEETDGGFQTGWELDCDDRTDQARDLIKGGGHENQKKKRASGQRSQFVSG
jgi:hypothetical protein